MNSFGRIFRVQIFGESHGPFVGVTIDGCPAGLPLTEVDFSEDIERRKGGTRKGTTPRTEEDIPVFCSGIFNNKTTGTPLTITFQNSNVRSSDYEKQRSIPRPGHADFVANKKFGGHEDYRGGGHFSGRLTLGIVAAGIVAKKLLNLTPGPSPKERGEQHEETPGYIINTADQWKGINISAKLIEVGGEKDIEAGLQKAIDAKDSVGGIIECRITGLPVGLGEPFFDSVESLLSHAIFAIPAIKGIEFGAGFLAAKMFGSEHNDAITDSSGQTKTNNAGGLVGGLTNGNDVLFRVVVKPTSSTPKKQESWSWESNQLEEFSVKGRHDLCIALRVPPVVEAVTAIVLADLMLMEQRTPRIVRNV
ncbi:MAG: chorismate synthase [Chitinophagaceae bacterium]